jgi:hypothetical protein
MANMFPKTFPDIRNTEGLSREKLVYDILKDMPDDYTIFYNTRLPLGSDPEIDFLILKENYAVIVLEVKGGRWRKNGGWHKNNESDIDPIQQVIGQKRSLISFLRLKAPGRLPWIPIMHALCFPDTHEEVFKSQLDSLPSIFGIQALPHLHECLDDLMTRTIEAPENMGREKCSRGLIHFIGSLVAPKSEKNIQVYLDHDESELDKVTQEFHAGLQGIYQNKRVAIKGSAGTGKTWMALKVAVKEAARGKKILVTCKTILLAQWLREQVGAKTGNIHVEAFEELMKRHLGDKIEDPQDLPPEVRNSFYKELPSLFFEDTYKSRYEKYNGIYVDEAQAFSGDHWTCIEALLSDADESKLCYFYDPDQRLYTEKDFTYLPDASIEFPLTINLRNTEAIYNQAIKWLSQPPSVLSHRVKGRPVYHINYSGGTDEEKRANQLKLISKILHQLISEYQLSSKNISLLSSNGAARNSLGDYIDSQKKLAGQNLISSIAEKPGITTVSIQKYRGLENQVVMLYDFREKDYREINYYGATRACVLLIIVIDEDIIRDDEGFLDGCVEIKLPELIPID